MRLRQLICCLLLLAAWSCPPHVLLDGDYALSPVEIVGDDCRFLPNGITLDADVAIAGHTLRMDLTFASLNLRLVGAFEENSEKFYADGSVANPTVTLNSQPCVVDSVNVHLQGDTDDARSFHGSVRAVFQTVTAPACNCIVSLTYRAVHR